jgi:hypothetical protein
VHDLNGLATETVREITATCRSKAASSIEAFGIDRRLEPYRAGMAQSRLVDSDFKQPPAEPGAGSLRLYE